MKTNTGLAQFAEESVDTPYIFGTYGQILTERLLSEKAKQYPSRLSATRVKYARDHYIGKRTTDCYGMVKRYKWTEGDAEHPSQNATPIYKASEDRSANAAYEKAKVKGPIGTMPDIPGICVRYNGHVGVYVGRDSAGVQWVVEARGFDYGTVRTKLKDRNWTHWFQEDGIQYPDSEPEKKPEDKPSAEGGNEVKVETLKKGMHGRNVLMFQSMMNTLEIKDDEGKKLAEDSSYGERSRQACIRYQKKVGLSADGICGPKTWDKIANG